MTRSDELLLERLEKQASNELLEHLPLLGHPFAKKWKRFYIAMRLLEMLTPGGSEFAGDPFECYSYAKKKIETLHNLAKERVKNERNI